jgi:hypothetical protein
VIQDSEVISRGVLVLWEFHYIRAISRNCRTSTTCVVFLFPWKHPLNDFGILNMELNKLKPCPFCGGEVSVTTSNFDTIGISCSTCEVFMEFVEGEDGTIMDSYNYRPLENSLLDALWQARGILVALDVNMDAIEVLEVINQAISSVIPEYPAGFEFRQIKQVEV